MILHSCFGFVGFSVDMIGFSLFDVLCFCLLVVVWMVWIRITPTFLGFAALCPRYNSVP